MMFLISQVEDSGQGTAIIVLGWIAVAAVAIYIIQTGVRLGMKAHDRESEPYPEPDNERSGKFIVRGVDRETKMDTTWHVQAESEANARIKADLEGIAVTSIQREI